MRNAVRIGDARGQRQRAVGLGGLAAAQFVFAGELPVDRPRLDQFLDLHERLLYPTYSLIKPPSRGRTLVGHKTREAATTVRSAKLRAPCVCCRRFAV